MSSFIGIGTVDEILVLHGREFLEEEVLERFRIGNGIDLVGRDHARRGEGERDERGAQRTKQEREAGIHHEIFAVVVSDPPLLSVQETLRSSPFLAPLKLNLT